jgi:phosphate transport system substrate-binding protein
MDNCSSDRCRNGEMINVKRGITRRALGRMALACSLAVAVVPFASARDMVDEALKSYEKSSGISGNLNSIGSDTLNNLMTLWAEKFNTVYPGVKVQIEGKGSGTAPPALIEGTAQIGPMSREMKATELDAFEKRFGYKPTPVRVAVDALAVFVHKDNPIKGLSLEQVDAIFSSTRKKGAPKDITTWGDLGLTGEWANKPISMYGRNSASGTYGFFKKAALDKGDFKNSVKEQPGSASVVQGISVDKYGIGYSGIGYKTSGVRAVPVAESGDTFVDATADNAYSGDYPLARFLLVYLNKSPSKAIDPMIKEFIRLIFSKEGQMAVVKDGYFPVSADLAQGELGKL